MMDIGYIGENMKRLTFAIVTVMILTVLLTAPGCGTTGSPGTLEGIRWRLDSYSASGNMKAVPGDSTADALFKGGTVSGNSGVNTFGGPYKLSGSDLTIGNLSTTLMAGPPQLMALEKSYLSNLGKVGSCKATGSTLTLFDENGKEILVYSKGKGTSLTGVTWNTVNYYNGRDAVTGVAAGSKITALFSDGGTVSGSAGLSDYSANYEIQGSGIKIGSPTLMSSGTAGNPALAQQETDYLAALQLASKYEISGNNLTLFRKDGGIAVTFTSSQ